MDTKERLNKIFRGAKIDMLLLVNGSTIDPNFSYITGFTSGTYEGNFLLATRDKATLLTSDLEYSNARSQAKEGLEIKNVLSKKGGLENELSVIKGKRLGINGRGLSLSDYIYIEKFKPKSVVDFSRELTKARLIKDEEEVANIRKAVSITKFAILEVQKSLKEGITELEAAAQVDFVMKSLGASGNAFDTIVAFGENSALPHHMPDSTRLKDGEIVLIDAGARYNNYCADITRSFVFGKSNKEAEEMIRFVKSAQLKAIRALKPGADAYKISQMVKRYIDNYANHKYKGKFIHALGHSIGVEVHDASVFGKTPYRKIKKGMTLAVEPGVYIEGLGGARIEDDVLISKEGAIVL